MKCSKCGHEINKEDKFCRECGQVVENNTPIKEEKKEEVKVEVTTPTKPASSKDEATTLCVYSIICYVATPILTIIFQYLGERYSFFALFSRVTMLLPFVAYGLAIYAKVKYPESKFAKVLLIVYIVLFVLAIVLMIVAVIACAVFLKNCLEGCNGLGNIIPLIFG